MHRIVPSIALVCALVPAAELLVNGDFEQPLTTGWVFTYEGTGTHTSDRAVDYHPDPDYEAQTYQYDNPGWARLGQAVNVRSPHVTLSFWASFEESGGTSSCWPAACFSVCYLDGTGGVIGETRYFYSTYADWTPSPTLSTIRVTNPAWSEYTLDIARELTDNLPGVDPSAVASVEVALLSYTYSG